MEDNPPSGGRTTLPQPPSPSPWSLAATQQASTVDGAACPVSGFRYQGMSPLSSQSLGKKAGRRSSRLLLWASSPRSSCTPGWKGGERSIRLPIFPSRLIKRAARLELVEAGTRVGVVSGAGETGLMAMAGVWERAGEGEGWRGGGPTTRLSRIIWKKA